MLASTPSRLMPPGEACFFILRLPMRLVRACLGSTVFRAKATLRIRHRGAIGLNLSSSGPTFVMRRHALCLVRRSLQHSHSREGEGFVCDVALDSAWALSVLCLTCKNSVALSVPCMHTVCMPFFENSPDSRLCREKSESAL